MSQPGASPDRDLTMRAALDAAADALDPAPARDERDGRVAWSAGGREIVVLDGATASFRVGVEIGLAARRTTDAGDSSMGPEWVAFRPPELDGHARDRITAWFAAAHRRASSPDRGTAPGGHTTTPA